jgi:hypothetical protein
MDADRVPPLGEPGNHPHLLIVFDQRHEQHVALDHVAVIVARNQGIQALQIAVAADDGGPAIALRFGNVVVEDVDSAWSAGRCEE